jgi:hypothetical protein
MSYYSFKTMKSSLLMYMRDICASFKRFAMVFCTWVHYDFDWCFYWQHCCYWLTDSQLTVLSCLRTTAYIAGVFVIYRWIYVHIYFVSQIFWYIRMGVVTFIDNLVLISALLAVLFKTGKLRCIYVFHVSCSVRTWLVSHTTPLHSVCL